MPISTPLFSSGPTVVAGCTISGGESAGTLAETAEFSLESRILPGTKSDEFRAQLRDFIIEHSPSAEVDIELEDTWLGGYADGCELSAQHPLALAGLEAVQANGYPDIAFTGSPLFCEGAKIASLGIPTLPALGPGRVTMAHQPDERANIVAIESCTEILFTLIERILSPNNILELEHLG